MSSMEMLPASEAPPLGTSLGIGYHLLRFLGAGGMGAVYEASAPDGRRVAVKVLLATALRSQEVAERFRREASVSSTLTSPHVLSAIDAGVDEQLQIPFMVMPLLVGTDLEGLLERVGAIHPVVVARIMRQACKALEVAHAAGVVHRDIKPANIFLDQDRAGNVTVRVLDFGIAKLRTTDSSLTRTGSAMGTPHYMSPEQIQSSKHVGVGSDIWSLGMTMYEALSTHLPFEDAETIGNLYVDIMTREISPIQSVAPWVDGGLAAIVHGTLIRDVAARCPSAAELSEALKPFTGGGDEVNAAMFEPLAPEMRAYQAPVTASPTHWQTHIRPQSSGTIRLTGTTHDPLLGSTIADRYTLLQCLGRGGMGSVYEGVTANHDRYAVKLINPEALGKEEAMRRFVREARAVMAIDSPNVVKVWEADTDPKRQLPYIVMEMLHGRDLDGVIEKRGALEPTVVARLFVQACRGIAAAHDSHFVHRDIKPANMFLHELPAGEVVVKICDFGIVKRIASDQDAKTVALTRTGGVVGSPMFMSPEQSKNARDIDLRTDVWSLGVSLFQALAGRHPWEGRETVGELIVAICTEQLPHVQEFAPWISPELAAVVHKAMSRDPAHRFQSMAELEAALLPHIDSKIAVRIDDLQAVSSAQRSEVAARTTDRGVAAQTAGSMSQSVTEAPRSRFGGAIVGALAVVGLAGAGAIFALKGPAPEPERPGLPARQPSAAATAEEHSARVAITPANATVLVDGKEHALVDGKLTLSGPSGKSFDVVVKAGEREMPKKIVITAEGEALPAKIALPAASADPSASAPHSAPATPPAPRPPTPAGPAPTPTPGPAPVPKPKPKDHVKDNWG